MRLLLMTVLLLAVFPASAKLFRDTVLTEWNDKIIITYNVTTDNNLLSIEVNNPPRIIPSKKLRNECKENLDKLKVVVFERKGGGYGKVKWGGLTLKPFKVPGGLKYDRTEDGYYILGESLPIEFHKIGQNTVNVKLPLHIAIYEKKHKYRIVSVSKYPLTVSSAINVKSSQRGASNRTITRQITESEQIAITSTENIEPENDDIIRAMDCIDMVKEYLGREKEVPFSQALQMEISNLMSLKNKINEPGIIDKINEVLLMCSDKERELKDAQTQSALAGKAEEQALLQQQKQEEEAKQKEAEEKARQQEEKQQKRTLWMIIGGVILAVLGFVGNAVFKHFRDVSNQKNILQMQESIARQAEHEATRRSREILSNKAHQIANKGRSKLRESKNGIQIKKNNSKRRSI